MSGIADACAVNIISVIRVIFAAVRLTACFSKLARSLKFSFKSKAITSGHFICQYNHVVKC
jgi:hypothetical protein